MVVGKALLDLVEEFIILQCVYKLLNLPKDR
jgi:hypothetical protein